MTVTVADTGFADLVRGYYRTVADDAVTAMLADMEAVAPRAGGVNDTGGYMTQSVELEPVDRDDFVGTHVHFPAEYATYQDEGVPGPILPVRSRYLHFFLDDGTEVFARSTSGVPRTGWFTDAWERWVEYLRAAL